VRLLNVQRELLFQRYRHLLCTSGEESESEEETRRATLEELCERRNLFCFKDINQAVVDQLARKA
jgi:hypothetical protein